MNTHPRIRVAVVVTKMDLGGAQQVALETAAGLDPRRFEVTLYSGCEGGLIDGARKKLGAHFVALPCLVHPLSLLSDFRAFLTLVREFSKGHFDVVHTHSSKAGILGRAAAWVAGVPVVCHTVHGWPFHDFMGPLQRALYVNLERVMAYVTHALVTVADSLAIKGQALGIGREGLYQTIRAASDLKAWRKQRPGKAALKKAGVNGSGSVVGCVANAKAQKCPEDFVRVAALVKKARFVYVGDGPRRPAAEALARRLGISDRMFFTGWAENPISLAAGFDVFLLTSLWEGLPCVFSQAMVLGLPVVATAVDGAPEIVKEGQTGYLCQPHDVEGMADRVNEILKDGLLRRRLSANAKKSVGREFELKDMISRHAALYEKLLQ